jgi:hypothetical protein
VQHSSCSAVVSMRCCRVLNNPEPTICCFT